MTYICFAAGPLQLICIKEFLYQKKINKYEIYLISDHSPNHTDIQMNETIKLLKLKNINQVYFSRVKIIMLLQRFFFRVQLLRKYKKINTAFLMLDFRNALMHELRISFKKSKFILIDDGSQTIESYNRYLRKNIYLPVDQYIGAFGKIKKFFLYGFQFRNLLFSKVEIFTIFAKDLDLSKNSFNSLSYVRSLLKKKIEYSNSLVYFSGTKLVERGALTLDQELNLLNKIKTYWKKKNKKLVYVAKRTSSVQKLREIRKKLSIETILFDLPLELEFIKNSKQKLPTIICSFGSTLNKSIPMIYKKIKPYYFDINKLL